MEVDHPAMAVRVAISGAIAAALGRLAVVARGVLCLSGHWAA